jgi:hypothetical protein
MRFPAPPPFGDSGSLEAAAGLAGSLVAAARSTGSSRPCLVLCEATVVDGALPAAGRVARDAAAGADAGMPDLAPCLAAAPSSRGRAAAGAPVLASGVTWRLISGVIPVLSPSGCLLTGKTVRFALEVRGSSPREGAATSGAPALSGACGAGRRSLEGSCAAANGKLLGFGVLAARGCAGAGLAAHHPERVRLRRMSTPSFT